MHKLGIVKVDKEVLLDLLKLGEGEIKSVTLINDREVSILLEHPEFPETRNGEIPVITPIFDVHYGDSGQTITRRPISKEQIYYP